MKKLLQAVEEFADSVRLVFRKQDTLRPGLDLEVCFSFGVNRVFNAAYTIHNRSGELIEKPYIMIGFPGFTNHRWINGLATTLETRLPKDPFLNFWQEAMSDSLKERTLLHFDPSVYNAPRIKGLVAISAFGASYVLQTTFTPTDEVERVYAEHTNKPTYLTSHLFVFLRDLPSGDQQTMRVFYRLSRH